MLRLTLIRYFCTQIWHSNHRFINIDDDDDYLCKKKRIDRVSSTVFKRKLPTYTHLQKKTGTYDFCALPVCIKAYLFPHPHCLKMWKTVAVRFSKEKFIYCDVNYVIINWEMTCVMLKFLIFIIGTKSWEHQVFLWSVRILNSSDTPGHGMALAYQPWWV